MDEIVITNMDGNLVHVGAADREITLPAGTYRMYVGYSADEIARETQARYEAEAKLDHWEALLGAAPDATGDASSEAFVRLSRGEEWS